MDERNEILSTNSLRAAGARNARHQLRTTATPKQLVSSSETNTDRFSTRLEAAVDRSREDDRNLEYQFNAHYSRPKVFWSRGRRARSIDKEAVA